MSWRMLVGGVLFLVPLLPVAAEDKKKPAEFEVKDVTLRVSGPYVHENLTVFLLHSREQDPREFITLDEGLEKKLVTVNEQEKEEVGQLVIDNKSDKHLFLQEGDRLEGGKQDRIIVTSLVIPPKSGPMPLPTFCCEAGRWTLGDQGKMFGRPDNAILAPLSVRAAAKYIPARGGQGEVWRKVADEKSKANMKLGSENKTSSLNEALDSKQVQKVCDACAKALNDLPAKHPDAVGVAIVVNGRTEEVNVYANAALFARVFPRLVQSYAVHAALEKDALKGKAAPAVTAADIEKYMSGKEKDRRFEDINKDNGARFRDLTTEVESVTAFRGRAIHRQWLNKAAVPEPAPEGKK